MGISDTFFEQAETRAEVGDLRGALRHLFDLFRHEPTHSAGLRLAASLSDRLGSRDESVLFQGVADSPDDPQGLYDLGYHFVEAGFPEVGVAFLETCHRRMPDHPLVSYELGYARFAAGEYRQAIPLLEHSARDETIAGPEPFFARTLVVESAVYQGDLERARGAFDQLDIPSSDRDGEAQVDALAQLLARADRFARKKEFSARDWHFLTNGGAVLHVDRAQDYDARVAATASMDLLGGLLRRLESVLGALDLMPTRVQFHGAPMRPVARAFAERIGAHVEPFDADQHHPSLIMAKDAASVSSLIPQLRDRDDGTDLFLLSIDPRRDHLVLPEVVGQFATALSLPWEERLEFTANPDDGASLQLIDADERSNDGIADEILATMARLEGDDDDRRALCRYYTPLKDLLVLGNYDKFPARRVYVARRPPERGS